jgi:uncharacterized protein YjbI with pentapeptide repeats
MMIGEKKGKKEKEERTCTYQPHESIPPCGRRLYDDEHCIFHSEDIEGKRTEFKKKFWKEFERQKEQEEKYDFTGFVFPGDISFDGIEFEKDVSFGKTQFSGRADFYNAQFSGKADFGEAQFYGVANFVEAQFYGGADFWKAQFSGSANFVAAKFSGEADFGGARFSGEAYFGVAKFSGEANFRNAGFHSKSFFKGVNFEDFNQCNMTDTTFYNVYGLLEYLAERKKKFKHPRGIKYLHDECKPILDEATVNRLPVLSREIRDDVYLMSFKEKHPKLHFIWWLFADCGRSFLRWALWSLIFAEVFAIIFGFFYYFNPVSFKSEVISFSWPGISFLYYSIVTFTTHFPQVENTFF